MDGVLWVRVGCAVLPSEAVPVLLGIVVAAAVTRVDLFGRS
jgi:hypothetical protein